MRKALKDTYQDTNALATFLSRATKIRKGDNAAIKDAKIIVEGNLPFKKTPLNIAKRGIDYSSLGVIGG